MYQPKYQPSQHLYIALHIPSIDGNTDRYMVSSSITNRHSSAGLQYLRRNFPASSSGRVITPCAALHQLLFLKCVKCCVSILIIKTCPSTSHMSPLLQGSTDDRVPHSSEHPSVHTPSQTRTHGPQNFLCTVTGPEKGLENLQGSPVHSGTL